MRFLKGHGSRLKHQGPRWRLEDHGYRSPCKVWQLTITAKGYGLVYDSVRGRMNFAHRVSYERERGALPDGMELDHLCRVRSCVNVEHLECVTRTTNVRRSQRTKLTLADATAVRWAAMTTTLTTRELGEMFGVSKSAVGRIVAGNTWKVEL